MIFFQGKITMTWCHLKIVNNELNLNEYNENHLLWKYYALFFQFVAQIIF